MKKSVKTAREVTVTLSPAMLAILEPAAVKLQTTLPELLVALASLHLETDVCDDRAQSELTAALYYFGLGREVPGVAKCWTEIGFGADTTAPAELVNA